MKHSNLIFAVLAIGLCVTLVFADNIVPAYAFSITQFSNGTADVRAVAVKSGETNFAVGDVGTDSVYVRNQNSKTQVGSTITGVTDPVFGFTVATQENRGYFYGGAGGITLYEIDLTNVALLRTLATACSATFQGVAVDETNGFFYCVTGTMTVVKYSIATFSATYTSTTLNAGGSACNGVEALSYDSARDIMFAACTGTSNIAAVEDWLVSGTPDFSVAYSATPAGLAFNDRESNVAVCSSGAVTPRIYDYDIGVGFTLLATIGTTAEQCPTNVNGGRMVYDHDSDRFFFIDGADFIRIFDATNGNSIISASTSGTNAGMVSVASNTQAWGVYIGDTGTGGTDYYVVDLTGIPLGSNGQSEGGGGTGDLDCTLPENENILICRLGGDGSLVGAGNFIVGNVNGTTGLTPIICATGIVDCVANPDMKTNGVGYLLVTIALAIIIGILWVASRGDLNSIPTFIWFVATLAVVGAFTLMDLIDATFLVITAIIVVALAAAKVRGLFGGEFR